jgi:hypothetical protein
MIEVVPGLRSVPAAEEEHPPQDDLVEYLPHQVPLNLSSLFKSYLVKTPVLADSDILPGDTLYLTRTYGRLPRVISVAAVEIDVDGTVFSLLRLFVPPMALVANVMTDEFFPLYPPLRIDGNTRIVAASPLREVFRSLRIANP